MQHDDQIGAALERQPIAGLLVAAVPSVAFVPDGEDLVLACYIDRIIGAAVVDHDGVVDNTLRDFPQRSLQRVRGIVGRQHNTDFLLTDQMCPTPDNLRQRLALNRRPIVVTLARRVPSLAQAAMTKR